MDVNRVFEELAGAVSFYSDYVQVISTGEEVIVQFYDTIPGPPAAPGSAVMVRTRLRTTITLSFAHAGRLANLLAQHASKGTTKPSPIQ